MISLTEELKQELHKSDAILITRENLKYITVHNQDAKNDLKTKFR